MVSHMREYWESGSDNSTAVAHGLAGVARIVAAASLIMFVVFSAALATTVLQLKQIGFALAVAVLLDATIIRLMLVPAGCVRAGMRMVTQSRQTTMNSRMVPVGSWGTPRASLFVRGSRKIIMVVDRARTCRTTVARVPRTARHHSRAAGSVNGVAWQANAMGAIPTRTTSRPMRISQVASSMAVRTASMVAAMRASRPLVWSPSAAPIRFWSWATVCGVDRSPTVNASVMVLAESMRVRQIGMAKFAAMNPITSRGASSPML
ncbi:MMPL family transporter [Virgisporangium aurantiacum]|uniref:MMPL family transporter n=1 Tax=Virgisporangium aurantiacum TaxID=175570 RepID=UPI0035712E64